MIIRGQSGFGDSIYLRGIVDNYLDNDAVIMTDYPDIFPDNKTVKYNKYEEVDKEISYLARKGIKETNQWEDMIISGGFKEKKPYRLNIECESFVMKAETSHKPVVAVVSLYTAFGENSAECNRPLTPFKEDFDKLVEEYRKESELIIVDKVLPFQLLCDIFLSSNKIICQQGWGTALAEGLGKPCDVIFTDRALKSDYAFINRIKPEKIFTKETSKAIILP